MACSRSRDNSSRALPALHRQEDIVMRHKVSINVADCSGRKTEVVHGSRVRLPKRLLKLLFGDFCEVFVLTPGQTVESVEIHELRQGGAGHEA